MTKKADKPGTTTTDQLFVYGLDEAGKPKGARFPLSEADKVTPVVAAMKLHSCQAPSEDVAAIGMKLPVGRIYARGKAFIPNIKRDLYDKLSAAIAPGTEANGRSQADGGAPDQRPLADGKDRAPREPGAAQLPPLASGLPQSWESIAVGNMILANAGPGEGWWECLVLARDSEIMTLRYRDYPKVPKFERHISTVALINPRPA
jgi:hypothetical protein